MERKVPPPRGFGGPPVAAQPLGHRNGPPTASSASAPNAPPPPPQSFGLSAVNTSNRHNWRPGRVGGRHDSPLYGKHRKRPSSSSIDSNVSWSGSEIESVGGLGPAHSESEQGARLSWASSVTTRQEASPPASQQDLASAASLFGAPAAEQTPSAELETKKEAAVQPPKTPLGKPSLDEDGGISAAQRVRMELSGSRAGSCANSSENVFVNDTGSSYDEEKNGPQSCPSTFNSARQPQFSLDKLRQLRSNELVASKLLPTRASVNSLMGYVRELQMSEASLRKQLVTTKQHTEEELTHSLSKVSELERSMQEVERDRELARRKLEEQEQLIRDLATKLKQAEAAKAKGSSASAVDELPSIAEETTSQIETKARVTTDGKQKPGAGVTPQAPVPLVQPPLPVPPRHPEKPMVSNRSAQFGLASPRSPNRPLWDPWASGGATPMKNLPPVFNVGSTGLDPMQTSTNDSTTTAAREYELKSVLMSPRRVQENTGPAQQLEQNEATAAALAPDDFAPQYPAPVFNVGSMPSPSYPLQQEFMSSEYHDVQNHKEVPLMESPSQAVPMLPIEPTTPVDDLAYGQQVDDTGDMTNAHAMEWNGFQAQQVPEASHPPPLANNMENNAVIAPPSPAINAEDPAILPPQTSAENAPSQDVAPPYNESGSNTQAELVPKPDANNAAANVGSTSLVGTSLPPLSLPSTSETQQPPAHNDAEPASAELVTLETLLVDFFTEVDKKRLKMAKAYGKRYAGREKWLFAELTKRYGAAKVGALKDRFENGNEGGASTTTTRSSSGAAAAAIDTDIQARNASETSNHPKAGRQGHPRHPQFFHPPAPASNADLGVGTPPVPSPLTIPQANDASAPQAAGAETPPSPSGKVSPGHAAHVSSRQRRSWGNLPPHSGPPSTFPSLQEASGGSNTPPAAVGTDGPSLMNGPPPSIQRDQLTSQVNRPPPPSGGMESNNTAPLGLRQRHNALGPGAPSQKDTGAEAPAATLEGLLKELYKKHQPDKLKNVSIVAKQYVGKERELVGLLKGKYGALSVKRLEENLEVLERTHRPRTVGRGSGKKRGSFVRTISLVCWLSVLLYFTFGAVFVSFVVLDAWWCRAVDSDEQELESSEECLPLKKELETFTYERMGDYVRQSHSDACFCSEWKARESVLFTNFSGGDFVSLARLVPFSPESFGDPWVATVKKQVPSQDFYASYTKPVVDLSLDVGSFVWSSALELVGCDGIAEGKSPVVSEAVDKETSDIAVVNEESESDALMGSQERAPEEETESFLNEAKVDVNQDFDAGDVVEAPQQAPVDEESVKLSDDEEIEEFDAATKDDASLTENDKDVVVPIEEEGATPTEERYSASFEIENKDYTTLDELIEEAPAVEESESIEVSESSNALSFEIENEDPVTLDESIEEARAVDESESIELGDDDSAVLEETAAEVKEVLFEDISVSSPVKEVESATYSPDEDNSADVTDEVSENMKEEDAEKAAVSTEKNSAVESEEVVELEVRQEGLDLTYPKTVADASASENVQVTDVLSPALAVNLESTLRGDGEIFAPSSEVVGTDTVSSELEIDDLAMNALGEDLEPEVNAAEEDLTTFIDEMVKSELNVGASIEMSEVEDINEDSASTVKEVGVTTLEENTVSEESDSTEEEADSDTSTLGDFEVEELETESKEVPADLLSEEHEAKSSQLEVDASSEAEAEMETLPEAEILSQDDHTGVLNEESTTTEYEIAMTLSLSDIDVGGVLSGDGVINEETVASEVSKEKRNDDEEEPFSDTEMPGDDDDISALAAEVEAEISELELEEEVLEQTEDAEIETFELEVEVEAVETKGDEADAEADELDAEALKPEQDAEEAVAALVEVGAVEEKVNEAETESIELDGPSDADVENLEDEVEQSESDEGLVIELGDASVEVMEVSDDAGAITADLDEHVDGSDTIDVPSSEREGADEEAIVTDDEETNEVEQETDKTEGETNGAEENNEAEDDAAFDEDSRVAETIETLAADDEIALVAKEEAESDVEQVLAADNAADGVKDAEEAPNAGDEPGVVENETSELQQVAEEVSTPEVEGMEGGGLVSAVNEVLARLVESFEAAKTAMPEVAAEAEHVVGEL